MTTWDAVIHDISEEHKYKHSSSPAYLAQMPSTCHVTVTHYQQPNKGLKAGDHIVEIRWDDSNGVHTKHCRIEDAQVKKRYQRHRAAGAFTDWGRIEVHMEAGGHPRVFLYSGVEEKPYEVSPQGGYGSYAAGGGIKDYPLKASAGYEFGGMTPGDLYSSVAYDHGGGGGSQGLYQFPDSPTSKYPLPFNDYVDEILTLKEKLQKAAKEIT